MSASEFDKVWAEELTSPERAAMVIRRAAARALNLPRINPVHPAVCALPEYRGAALEGVTPAGAARAMRNVMMIGGAK